MKTQGSQTDVVFLSGVRTGLRRVRRHAEGLLRHRPRRRRRAGTRSSASGVEPADVGPRRLRQRAPDLRRRASTSPATSASGPACRSRRRPSRSTGSAARASRRSSRARSRSCSAKPRRRARRRHRVDEPGAARGARRALGPPPRPAAAARGPALGGAAATRSAASPWRRPPRTSPSKYRLGRERGGRVCRCASQQRAKAAWDERRLRRRGRARSRSRTEDAAGRELWAPTSTCGRRRPPRGSRKLPPYFKKDGVVTAGNASGICDGARRARDRRARATPRRTA